MVERTYTQEEVNQLQKEWESNLFEEKTKEFMVEVRTRLDQSNGYKETIGKDVTDIKSDVKELRVKVLELENARLKAERDAKIAQDKKDKWYQDRWIRAGIAAGIIWEAWTIFGEPLKVAAHHLGWG